jgi:hypothetical protein
LIKDSLFEPKNHFGLSGSSQAEPGQGAVSSRVASRNGKAIFPSWLGLERCF